MKYFPVNTPMFPAASEVRAVVEFELLCLLCAELDDQYEDGSRSWLVSENHSGNIKHLPLSAYLDTIVFKTPSCKDAAFVLFCPPQMMNLA